MGALFKCNTPVQRTDCQTQRAIEFIESARKAAGSRNLIVLTFIHGWHHNASWYSENFRNFQRAVDCLNWGAEIDKVLYRDASKTAAPFSCGSLSGDPDNRYVGVYIGWRGESMDPRFKVLTALSLPSRHDAASRIAAQGELTKTLQVLSKTSKSGTNPAKLVVIGHSFGGLISNRVTGAILDAHFQVGHAAPPSSCGDGHSGRHGFADMMVLLNPADSSIRAAELIRTMKEDQEDPEFFCSSLGVNPAIAKPIIISLHTSSDIYTDTLGVKALKISKYDKNYPNKKSLDFTKLPSASSQIDDPPSFESLRADTINHALFLHNLCYLDQPNRMDPICAGMNDVLYHAKERAFKSVELDKPTPTNFWGDAYYHGAYELLTSVCYEPNEAPTTEKDSKHNFSPEFASPPCQIGSELANQRERLRLALEEELKDYLAFPHALHEVNGSLLLDVYVRKYVGCYRDHDIKVGDVPPLNCTKDPRMGDTPVGQMAWNTTPFWTLNTSYEIIQEHSAFWNSDVLSLITGFVAQFPAIP